MAKARQQERADRDLALAWMMAGFSRQKKLQPLARVLEQGRRREGEQRMRALTATVAMLSAQTGYPIRRIPLPASA